MSIVSRRRPSLRGRWIALTLGALLAAVAWAGPSSGLISAYAAPGSQTAGLTLSARAGFDSYFKDSQWTPVRVTVANDGPDVSGDLQMIVPRNGGETLFTRPVELPTQSRREVYFYLPLEGYISSLQVDLVSGQKILASADVRLSQTGPQDTLYGVLAASPTAYNSLADVKPLNGNTIVAQLDLADLPPLAAGWMSLDALVIADTDTGAFSLEQRQALADWVQQGGRLIVVEVPPGRKRLRVSAACCRSRPPARVR